MKLIKGELRDRRMNDAIDKVQKRSPWDSPVRKQIRKNFGLWDDDLITLKIRNPKLNIRRNLDETN